MAGFARVIMNRLVMEAFLDGEVSAAIAARVGPAIERGAKERALVRTGTLLDSIEWSLEREHGTAVTEVHAIFYDLFQERPARQIRHATRALMDALRDETPKLL